jgi:hypothetical protein
METAIWIVACIILCFIAGNIINNKNNIIELQKEIINNYSAAIKNYQSILEKGITLNSDKPQWLNDDLCREVKDLWNSSNTADNYNPRVKATKMIQDKFMEVNDRKLPLQEACEIIKKHCL